MKTGNRPASLRVLVDSIAEDGTMQLQANNKAIRARLEEFSDFISIKSVRTSYADGFEVDDTIQNQPFMISDIGNCDYDVFITSYSGYYHKYIGSRDVREYTKEILREASANPARLYLLWLHLPETDSIELAFENLPDADSCLPENIFLRWDDFLQQLRDLYKLAENSQPENTAGKIIKTFEDMPLMLRLLLQTPGNGGKFFGDFQYNRWHDWFSALEKKGLPPTDPLVLRTLIFSGSQGRKYFCEKIVIDPQDSDTFLAEIENRFSTTPSFEELVDLVAALDLISDRLSDIPDFRSRAVDKICHFIDLLPAGEGLKAIYEAFVLNRYRCFKHLQFVAEIAVAATRSDREAVAATCEMVKSCNLLDPWEKFATSLPDINTVTSLFVEKLQDWFEHVKLPKRFHKDLLEFFEKGSGAEKVEKIAWRIMNRMSAKYSDQCSTRITTSDYNNLNLKKTLVDGAASFNFYQVFLAEFQCERYPELYRRLQVLWLNLCTLEAIDLFSNDNDLLNFFFMTPEKCVSRLAHALESELVPGDVSVLIRYAVFELSEDDDEDDNESEKCLAALINLIRDNQQRVEAFYRSIGVVGTIGKSMPENVHNLLMEMAEEIPPTETIIGKMKKDKRKRIREISEILELGRRTSSTGMLLDEYLRDNYKDEFMEMVREKLSAIAGTSRN